ncbi:ATP-dependent DNA/RNA helicase DHX36-like [Leptidea sinapis]|uniref:ATP-dependent DNA/RNA helicase DHX36-like n=1 Tax=Leptidea sinapis TaxID=189913 RepID=UPI0021C2B9DC|nr:ATP-dependent DNA/RNA helicase DHX36-like [Leptidea sinapis]
MLLIRAVFKMLSKMDNQKWKKKYSSRGGKSKWLGENGIKRPPGLRGREIGMYYKHQSETQPKEKFINLKIPQCVLNTVDENIIAIEKIAVKENISIPDLRMDFNSKSSQNNHPTIKIEGGEDNAESSKVTRTSSNDLNNDASKSMTDDQSSKLSFNNINAYAIKEEIEKLEHNLNTVKPESVVELDDSDKDRFLDLREQNHFKYGYMDIITGSFEEKLKECINQRILVGNTGPDIVKMNATYQMEYDVMKHQKSYKSMLELREMLPTYKERERILNMIKTNQVIVLSGETGCGKSTQIPQIILDDALCNGKGANLKILVTQPRRIAASSLAMRVAKERAENVGKSVGYSVRLERVEPRQRGSIIFCTTGVLLAELEVNQGLTSFSHIILDEVHERDTHVDLAMCMLKKILEVRKDLKLILMSATLDADVLSTYFDDCPVVKVEGLAYPVRDVYLEDILELTRYQLKEPFKKIKEPNPRKWRGKGQDTEKESDKQYQTEIGPWLESIKKKIPTHVYNTLNDPRIEDIQIGLIVELLIYICKGEPGAILVFLPGISEISKLIQQMEESNHFPSSLYQIYPLHSKLPTLEQHKIFERPPKNIRKIIIGTNIAETSITIDDIVYVVDCGKIKMSGLNVKENIITLNNEWVSKANLHQRRGRAGRCQPGVCFHLITSHRASLLADRLLPELQRSNLLEPVLTIKKLRLGLAAEAFQLVPSPPAASTVDWAISHLQKCGALDDRETLTPLGWHLARLPVHPAAGKLLLLGALFGCLDRAASVAAVWSFKDPFQLVIGKEAEVKATKREFAMGEPSDHMALAEAVMQWEICSGRNRRSFAYDHFLSAHTLHLLVDMKTQLGHNLKCMGFLPSGDVYSSWENRNWENLSLFKAIIAAALYPNIAAVKWRIPRNPRKVPSITVTCPQDGKVVCHPSSVMAAQFSARPQTQKKLCDNPGANWLVYWLKQRSSDLFLIDVTLVYTLPLLFFGEFAVKDDPKDSLNCLVSIGSINVRVRKDCAERLFKLRYLLDQVLARKVMVGSTHAIKRSQFEEMVLKTVIRVITAEDEQVDYIEDDNMSFSD